MFGWSEEKRVKESVEGNFLVGQSEFVSEGKFLLLCYKLYPSSSENRLFSLSKGGCWRENF